ncbi:MAG TPA: VOC family protein [Solirubrobacteraceae bacterium]
MPDLAPTVIPAIRYRDAVRAVDFLVEAFGFERNAVYADGDVVHHAQLTLGGAGMVMVSSETADGIARFGEHAGQGWTYCVVPDPDAHCARARAAGAEIFRELEDQDYGSRDYSARDFEGNIWSFGTYRPEV